MTKLSADRGVAILALSLSLSFSLAAAGVAAQQCQPSRWGAQDEVGAANHVSPEQVLLAAKLVKQGQSHPPGIVIDPAMLAFPPRSFALQVVQPGQHNGGSLRPQFGWDLVYNDDMAQLWFGIGSQLDGLGHMGEAGAYYNCNEAVGADTWGVDAVPPVEGDRVFYGHIEFLRNKGIYLLETMNTGRLAREGVREFMFVLG